MALKHDAQGFLTGDPIDIGRALDAWDDIRDDVRAIRHALAYGAPMSPMPSDRAPGVPGGGGAARPVSSGGRNDRQIPAPVRPAATPQTGGTGAQKHDSQAAAAVGQAIAAAGESRKAAAKPASRDGRGRFIARGGSGGGDDRAPDAPNTKNERDEAGGLRGVAERIAVAIKESGGGMEEVDPTVKAFNEVAQPMARGYELLTGGSKDKRQEGWLRRIWTSLAGFRKDETAFNKAANKSLKNIEEKPAGGESGSGGIWGTILSAIMGIGPAILAGIGALLSKIPFIGPKIGGAGAAGGAADAAGTGAAGAAGGATKSAGGFFKGALKKIPLLGSLLAVGGAAADIIGSENDDKLSRREKDKNAGKAIGGAGGTIGGMMAGAAAGAFAGPVGMAIGGMVGAFLGDQAGQIIGDTVGGWVNDLRNADIAGSIVSAWDSVVSGFKSAYESIGKTWGGFVDSAKAGWDTIANLFASAYDGLKSIPLIGPAIQAVEDAAKKTAEAAKAKAVEVGTKAVEGAKAGAEYLGNNTTIGKGVKAAVQGAAVVAEKIPAAAERAYNVTAATAGSALETVMPKGYRHKALFDGIQGGDSLTQYGSYTDEEAARIRDLKTSGANTSANVKGGMSLEVQDKISAQAKKAGLDPVMMQKIASMESGGNANAISSTGAVGIYQFTGQTASGVGIKNRFDVDQNIEGGMKLTRQNQAALEKSGLPVSAENLYMMHQLGPKAAQEVIRGAADGKSKADMSPETQKAMNLNYGANSATAADYLATNKKALDDRYAVVTKDTGGAPTAIAKANSATPAAPPATPDSSSTPPAVAQVAPSALPPRIAAPAMPSVVVSASMPSVPAMPIAPSARDAPPMTMPVTGGGSNRPIQVSLPSQDVGQDVRERQIAHIVTGGLSA